MKTGILTLLVLLFISVLAPGCTVTPKPSATANVEKQNPPAELKPEAEFFLRSELLLEPPENPRFVIA